MFRCIVLYALVRLVGTQQVFARVCTSCLKCRDGSVAMLTSCKKHMHGQRVHNSAFSSSVQMEAGRFVRLTEEPFCFCSSDSHPLRKITAVANCIDIELGLLGCRDKECSGMVW